MDTIRSDIAKARAFFAAHRAARIAGYILAAWLVFVLVFHPKGTKTFLLLGMDNYGSLNTVGRSDVMMLVQVDFTRADISTVTFARDMFIPDENGRKQKINTIVRQSVEEALVFARCRQLDNDMGRGERQNKVMAAMVAQTKRMTIANVVSVFSSLKHAWVSSLSGFEQVRLLGNALWLRGAHVNSIGMPLGNWKYANSGVEIKMEENVQLLHEALGLPAPVFPDKK